MTQLYPPSQRTNPSPPAPEYLRLDAVSKAFGGVQALSGVSFSLQAGGLYHLMGENGSGKSTLIKIISGAQPPDSGSLVVRGQPYARLRPLQAIELGIETVYQDLSLFQNLSVMENVALTAQLVRQRGRLARLLDRGALRDVARRALTRVGLPADADFLSRPVEALPIATRQLVAIARGIATQASLVIMDEPTTALTQREVDTLVQIVGSLGQDGVTVLFVSHKLDEVFRIGGEAIVMRDGRMVAQEPLGKLSPESLSYHMTGRRLRGERYRTDPTPGHLLLEARDLGRAGAFRNVSFELRAGEILGVTGLLDSGRNELARALAGVEPADHGALRLDGHALDLRSPRDALAHRIGYVPEDRLNDGLFANRPITENITVSILDTLAGARGGRLNRARMREVAESYVGRLAIATPDTELPVQSLSGGNQQRVLISRWLATAPQLLILHGPTMGVDVGSKDALYRFIQGLAKEGLGIIVISDDLPELLQNCDRILVMKRGVIAERFDAAGLREADLARSLLSDAAPDPAAAGGAP